MSNRRLARAAALVALSALAGMACNNTQDAGPRPSVTAPGDTVTPSAPTTSTTIAPGRNIDVAFAGGQVVGGPRKEAVRLGEMVRIRVTSDVADEVHVHTYDVRAEVAPQRVAEAEVTATIPGRHEVELESAGKLLLTLEVR
jgi:hypothetical protein